MGLHPIDNRLRRPFTPQPEDAVWPIPMHERARLALAHEPAASSSPDGFRLATCVVPQCQRPMVAMWHLWLDDGGLKKEIHMCHVCATDIYGAPDPTNDERSRVILELFREP